MKLDRAEEAWSGTVGVAIVCCVFAGVTIAAAGAWPWFVKWLDSGNAAAWVQAVGSIGAIMGTMWAARHQVAKQSAEQERVRKLVDQEKLAKAFQIYSQLCETAESVIKQFATQCKNEVVKNNIGYFAAPLVASMEGVKTGLSIALLDDLPTDLVVAKFTVMTMLADLVASVEQVTKNFEAREDLRLAKAWLPTTASAEHTDQDSEPLTIDERKSALAFNLMEGRLRTAVRLLDEVEGPIRKRVAASIVRRKA